jgi:hypothetical protein
MAIKLFRKGNTHRVNGIECEVRLFPVKYGQSFVGVDGWCVSVEDLEKKEVVEIEEEIESGSIDQPSKVVRELAKEAGIDGWEKKRISTLKEELGGEGE